MRYAMPDYRLYDIRCWCRRWFFDACAWCLDFADAFDDYFDAWCRAIRYLLPPCCPPHAFDMSILMLWYADAGASLVWWCCYARWCWFDVAMPLLILFSMPRHVYLSILWCHVCLLILSDYVILSRCYCYYVWWLFFNYFHVYLFFCRYFFFSIFSLIDAWLFFTLPPSSMTMMMMIIAVFAHYRLSTAKEMIWGAAERRESAVRRVRGGERWFCPIRMPLWCRRRARHVADADTRCPMPAPPYCWYYADARFVDIIARCRCRCHTPCRVAAKICRRW